jgi:hypothetical protein
MKPLQKRYQYFQHFRKAIQQGNFPIGTIAYFGPDDQNVTKIVVAILPDENSDPVVRKWVGEGVAQNKEAAIEIGNFFKNRAVQNIVMTDGIIGCPHEEGVDFPIGKSCTKCEFWLDAS